MKLLATILVILCTSLPSYAQSASSTSEDEKALSAVTRELCRSQVAMLGESATHGDGHTLAFKVALVERLIDECGFDSVFFESNHIEFIHANQRLRSGEAVSAEDLLAAVGGLWRFYREFQPLAPFLLKRAQNGRVFLGGLDDQLGQFGQDYANVKMVSELTDLLPQPERQNCSSALHKRIYSDYSDTSPYSEVNRTQINTCLSEIQAASAADKSTKGADREDRMEMIAAVQRWVSRDFSSAAESMVNRDRSMFQNFEWLEQRAPKRHKIIIWSATVHIAKQGDPTWGDHLGTNFGSFIHRKYGERSYALGFSALSGSYRQGKGRFPLIPATPANSVEARALQSGTASSNFVGQKELSAMGGLDGAFFKHSYQTLSWSNFLDGVVVFRQEHPPTDEREK